jgi:hypothetical protein
MWRAARDAPRGGAAAAARLHRLHVLRRHVTLCNDVHVRASEGTPCRHSDVRTR